MASKRVVLVFDKDVDLDQYLSGKTVRPTVAASPMQRALLVQALRAAGFIFDENRLIKACIHVSQPIPNALRIRAFDKSPNAPRAPQIMPRTQTATPLKKRHSVVILDPPSSSKSQYYS